MEYILDRCKSVKQLEAECLREAFVHSVFLEIEIAQVGQVRKVFQSSDVVVCKVDSCEICEHLDVLDAGYFWAEVKIMTVKVIIIKRR